MYFQNSIVILMTNSYNTVGTALTTAAIAAALAPSFTPSAIQTNAEMIRRSLMTNAMWFNRQKP